MACGLWWQIQTLLEAVGGSGDYDVMAQLDEDGDGEITLEEFERMLDQVSASRVSERVRVCRVRGLRRRGLSRESFARARLARLGSCTSSSGVHDGQSSHRVAVRLREIGSATGRVWMCSKRAAPDQERPGRCARNVRARKALRGRVCGALRTPRRAA